MTMDEDTRKWRAQQGRYDRWVYAPHPGRTKRVLRWIHSVWCYPADPYMGVGGSF